MNDLITSIRDFLFPDTNKYLTFSNGISNTILSAPHGGNLRPISIPRRTYGNRSRDTYARDIVMQLSETMNKKPYYVYSNIHRDRIDLNRDIEEACQGNKTMERVWERWNGILDSFLNEVRYYHKKGLYIDIHTHSNHDKFMIGYGIPVKDYLHLLNDDKIPTKNSTMHELKEFNKDKYTSEHSILFGEYSIFQGLKHYGYKVLTPTDDKNFLNGGRDIQRFRGNGIGSMQIECPISVLKNDFKGVTHALKESIELFENKFLTEL